MCLPGFKLAPHQQLGNEVLRSAVRNKLVLTMDVWPIRLAALVSSKSLDVAWPAEAVPLKYPEIGLLPY